MIILRPHPDTPTEVMEEVKELSRAFPGDHLMQIRVADPEREIRLSLSTDFKYSAEPGLIARLEQFGRVEVITL